MNTTAQEFFGTRGFRIAVIAGAAVIVLAAAAYLFGTGLRADTPASVAPSPLGSSLTNVRESLSQDYADRLMNASAAARIASLAAANRFADRYDSMNSSAAASGAALRAMIESSGSADYAARAAGLWYDLPASPAERTALLEMINRNGSADYSTRSSGLWFDVPAAGTMASQPAGISSTSPATGRSASPAELAERWAPFYAGLDKALKDAGARTPLGSSSGMTSSSREAQYQWIKPEGIKPSAATDSAVGQFQWIKPERVVPN